MPKLTILFPCLNESKTIATCVEQAKKCLDNCCIDGEILVVDNNSDDASALIAKENGATVVSCEHRGYGNAIRLGIDSALGEFVVMCDADLSYDLNSIPAFLELLDSGYDLVMGNRFAGVIHSGAMPWHHRYIGNPILSGLGRVLFPVNCHDFHCGIRGFRRKSMRELVFTSTGMEFASEMVIKSKIAGLRITEIPVDLRKDGRGHPGHIRWASDGLRHLLLILLLSIRSRNRDKS